MPMVERLRSASLRISALARSEATANQLRDRGADVLTTPNDIGSAADVLCVCVLDDEQVAAVLRGADGALVSMRPGSQVVIHTTGSPRLAEQLQTEAPDGVEVLDAPVSGTAADVTAGQLTVLIGGTEAGVEAVRPILSVYAAPVLRVGRLGDGQRTKLVNNALFAAHVKLADDAIQLATQLGLTRATALSALQQSSGRSFGVEVLAATPDGVSEGLGEFLDKDIATVEKLATDLGIGLGDLGRIASWWRRH